jgi:hypothetical protein
MNFLEKTDASIGLYHCFEDENRIIGICPVMFGYRIRAGWKSNQWFETDWCAGANLEQVKRAYAIQLAIIMKIPDFRGVPERSQIKPMQKDAEFLLEINSMITDEEVEKAYNIINQFPLDLEDIKRDSMNSIILNRRSNI